MQKDGDREQGGKRIKPWDMERGIRSQAGQGSKSQISAGGRLNCIGCQSNIVRASSFSPLECSQDRHGDQSNDRHDDSQSTRLRLYVKQEREQRCANDDERQSKKQNSSEAPRTASRNRPG